MAKDEAKKNDETIGEKPVDAEAEKAKTLEAEALAQPQTPADAISHALAIVHRGAQTRDVRIVRHGLQVALTKTRRKLTSDLLEELVRHHVKSSEPLLTTLLQVLAEAHEVESEQQTSQEDTSKDTAMKDDDADEEKADETTEQNAYTFQVTGADPIRTDTSLALLSVLILVRIADLRMWKTLKLTADTILDDMWNRNNRMLDVMTARMWHYVGLASEHEAHDWSKMRERMLTAYRSASHRHDEPGQAVLTNLVLRLLVNQRLYDQAHQFRQRATFPLQSAEPAQLARYHYYCGRIDSLRLAYGDAERGFQMALRRGPQHVGHCGAFRRAVSKHLVTAQMLAGDIPSRDMFEVPEMKKALRPYLALAQAVRAGNLEDFAQCCTTHEETYRRDQTWSLVQRLRHNVIKTGLRNMSLSYSHISLDDVARKLSLETGNNTVEYVVAKAVHDGVIEAFIQHSPEGPIMISRASADVYATDEPLHAFNKRTRTCMMIHNEAVKALRFPRHSEETEDDKTAIQLDEQMTALANDPDSLSDDEHDATNPFDSDSDTGM
ncbi:MAG: hypothetical protein MHM6MM_001601 [Cercozoa sp. M6MM]